VFSEKKKVPLEKWNGVSNVLGYHDGIKTDNPPSLLDSHQLHMESRVVFLGPRGRE
jgi:hypothetical protein